jgi:hypothetical protein
MRRNVVLYLFYQIFQRGKLLNLKKDSLNDSAKYFITMIFLQEQTPEGKSNTSYLIATMILWPNASEKNCQILNGTGGGYFPEFSPNRNDSGWGESNFSPPMMK